MNKDIKLNENQQQFVIENHNLIYSFINKYNLNYEDYYDITAIGLVKAVLYFDKTKGYNFSTYAFKCMYTTVFSDSRKYNNDAIKYAESLETKIFSDSEELVLSDITLDKNTESIYEDIEYRIDIQNELTRLTDKELEILYEIARGSSQREIANKYKCSKQYVNSTLLQIKRKFKGEVVHKKYETSSYRKVLINSIEEFINQC